MLGGAVCCPYPAFVAHKLLCEVRERGVARLRDEDVPAVARSRQVTALQRRDQSCSHKGRLAGSGQPDHGRETLLREFLEQVAYVGIAPEEEQGLALFEGPQADVGGCGR